ncbi:cytidine and deoxycytidylate deaminase zinc-binding region family protein [Dickeya phage phiDP23.1]|uniref:Deoxycytidylate deaminase n=16 Tax=Aglimvirinae TaxID=2169530 RepID=I0J2P3_9CAUD|nr:dCMP deaminase [Dickeya phage vB-DsoM-LIMEstone1]YP_009103026.1 dCMP deaminase [Dickeya phage RC-2014]AIM51432.1 cytidine and deoxycytidylate deaminase zinc-binding region family protein [Dickeya phage phiD3]AIM51530.1 cytidine and deoxycytidylate deaminase zinc-binding region family protein [Dickeya phage phiDP10.3]AIM51981.1 cytidine and deoxycytidylate deaminase zinc-binding region family protein [Dickeya phage phiDP23.1]ASD51204.1 putative deoxycytidylate deaminase [Dickeya phage JA15]
MAIKPRMLFAHMRSAHAYALSSYAQRLKVGCVIVDEQTDQPVAIGWNGTAPGAPNVCEQEVDGELVSVGVVHAEENALMRIPEALDNRVDLTMFVSHSPCPVCTQLIIKSCAIKKVIYNVPYRITDGIIEMLAAGIEVYRMVDQFAVVQHSVKNGELVSTPVLVNPDK